MKLGKYDIRLQVAVSPYIHPYTHTIHVRPAGTGVVVVVDWLRLHLFPTPLAASKEIRGTDSDPSPWIFLRSPVGRKFCGSRSGWDDGKKTEVVMENHGKKLTSEKNLETNQRVAGVCM